MRYNTTYTPTVSLYETIVYTNALRELILKFFSKNYNLNFVLAPAFFLENDTRNVDLPEISRSITFDSADEYKVGKVSMSDSAFLRQLIIKTKAKTGSGFFSENSFIWRDMPETPTSSITKHEITIQIVLNEISENTTKKVAQELYGLIHDSATALQKTKKIKNIYPQKPQIITAQNLEDEFSNKSASEREKELANEQAAFILKNPAQKLRSGKTHTKLPDEIYAIDNFLQIAMKDRVNAEVLKVASISEIAIGKKLMLQTKGITTKQISEYDELFKAKSQILEIKINLPRLVMALLGKGHIVEVQPDVFSNETKVVKLKYKVEAF